MKMYNSQHKNNTTNKIQENIISFLKDMKDWRVIGCIAEDGKTKEEVMTWRQLDDQQVRSTGMAAVTLYLNGLVTHNVIDGWKYMTMYRKVPVMRDFRYMLGFTVIVGDEEFDLWFDLESRHKQKD